MVTSRTFRDRFETFLIYFGLTLFTLIAILPFLNTIARSFSAEAPITRGEVYVWPVQFTLDAYRRLIVGGAFWRAYQNSFIITTVGTIVQMAMTMLAAYPLSRSKLPGRGFLTLLVIVQMIFPPGLIPFYLTVRGLGLMDTYWSVILPYAINTFNMIVLMSYFRSLPPEMEEAAVIDGANDLQVLWRVVVPLCRPVILTLTLFYVVENWNLLLPAIFFINDGTKQPLQVVLRDMVWSTGGGEAFKAASVLLAGVPMVVFYPFVQRYFVRGILLGAVSA